MLPDFDSEGNLPVAIHGASEEEVSLRFGTTSARRRWLGERLRNILALAKSTGKLFRVFLWGSFVTGKKAPNDLDMLLVMAPDFSVGALPVHCQTVFDHAQARLLFEADVFWTKASIDGAVLQLWLDTYQFGKDFKRRGIVEVVVS
jgi:hypothetical protein